MPGLTPTVVLGAPGSATPDQQTEAMTLWRAAVAMLTGSLNCQRQATITVGFAASGIDIASSSAVLLPRDCVWLTAGQQAEYPTGDGSSSIDVPTFFALRPDQRFWVAVHECWSILGGTVGTYRGDGTTTGGMFSAYDTALLWLPGGLSGPTYPVFRSYETDAVGGDVVLDQAAHVQFERPYRRALPGYGIAGNRVGVMCPQVQPYVYQPDLIDLAIALRAGAPVLDARLFDAAWYLDQNEDVAAAWFTSGRTLNLWSHYLASGAAEGRNPNPLFSSAGYLAANPDVGRAGMNPLVHYRAFGWMEGRRW